MQPVSFLLAAQENEVSAANPLVKIDRIGIWIGVCQEGFQLLLIIARPIKIMVADGAAHLRQVKTSVFNQILINLILLCRARIRDVPIDHNALGVRRQLLDLVESTDKMLVVYGGRGGIVVQMDVAEHLKLI